jgi:hypothetical protein
VVAEGLLQQLSLQQSGAGNEVGYVCGFLAARGRQRLAKLDKLWKKFKPLEPPH